MWTTVFFILGLAAVAGIFLGLLIGVPLLVYTIPYMCWFGWNSGSKGIPQKAESEILLKGFPYMIFQAKNATKLYRSWLTKKPHGITRF